MSFREFSLELWGHEPFPWQERLAGEVLQGRWPETIALPTAAGKTGLIDIAVFALGMAAPQAARRIFFVVDRRVIVDEADERANQIAERLLEAELGSMLWRVAEGLRQAGGGEESPLLTRRLRGGVLREDEWSQNPRQPAVICSTVDQVGSALLFRSYGSGPLSASIRAGLTAFDSLIILDEAHTSQPFAETLAWLKRYRHWAERRIEAPFTVVEMSATPRSSRRAEPFREDERDHANQLLQARWTREKRARLVSVEPQGDSTAEQQRERLARRMAEEAERLLQDKDARVAGVIANRVNTARMIHSILQEKYPGQALLLTGRARPYDRDVLWERHREEIRMGRAEQPERPVFVVATQCIEVGANIDLDVLVTELASLDALEQRFGRLNRGGRLELAHAAVVAMKEQVRTGAKDPVYGGALPATWKWLESHVVELTREELVPSEGTKKPKKRKVKERFVPMDVVRLRQNIAAAQEIEEMLMPARQAPVMLPAHLDLLVQTAPQAAAAPEPAVFLHGPESGPADVSIVWRADLDENASQNWADRAAACPPHAAEAIQMPVWTVRKWLRSEAVDVTDLEGETPEEERRTRGTAAPRSFLCWGEDPHVRNDVKPGMTILVPATYGGCDEWGWNPESPAVRDVGDKVAWRMRRVGLRLSERLARSWGYDEAAKKLRQCETKEQVRAEAAAAVAAVKDAEIREILNAISRPGRLTLIPDDEADQPSLQAVVAPRFLRQSGSASSYSRKIELDDHLKGCAEVCARHAAALGQELAETLRQAAELHDIGKADERFQAWLRGGSRAPESGKLAKSERSAFNRAAVRRARELAGYPDGGRHEMQSVAMLAGRDGDFPGVDFDLMLHLIGSHHGHGRPFAPVVQDPSPVVVEYGGYRAGSAHGLERAGSGVADRFWRLNRRYGWYGLAYLEALLRLADHIRSRAEDQMPQEELAHG